MKIISNETNSTLHKHFMRWKKQKHIEQKL